jgi:hypothetical protein
MDLPTDITDAELDAATLAYVGTRWPDKDGEVPWRKAHPQAWLETRDRMRFALLAAAEVRGVLNTAAAARALGPGSY